MRSCLPLTSQCTRRTHPCTQSESTSQSTHPLYARNCRLPLLLKPTPFCLHGLPPAQGVQAEKGSMLGGGEMLLPLSVVAELFTLSPLLPRCRACRRSQDVHATRHTPASALAQQHVHAARHVARWMAASRRSRATAATALLHHTSALFLLTPR